MSASYSILLLEDEPLILMDIEMAGHDRGCDIFTATTCDEALNVLDRNAGINIAILDVTLADGCTCVPVARELAERGIPFLLHSGDLDRQNETVRELAVPLIAKPAAAEKVIAAAITMYEGKDRNDIQIAAE